jgi:hypothetical protein
MTIYRHVPHATSRRTLLFGAAATLAGSPLAAQDAAAGKIASLHGDAFAEGTSTRRSLQPAADVFVGDLVETDASSGLIMQLGKTTTVKLGALAKFRIDKFVINAGGTLDLEQGAMLVDRNDDAKKESLQVRSPFGLIAVRGTMFFAGPSNNVFGVFVGRGAVAVTSGGETVNLRVGQGTDIAKPGAPPSAPKGWGQDRVAAALGSVG